MSDGVGDSDSWRVKGVETGSFINIRQAGLLFCSSVTGIIVLQVVDTRTLTR